MEFSEFLIENRYQNTFSSLQSIYELSYDNLKISDFKDNEIILKYSKNQILLCFSANQLFVIKIISKMILSQNRIPSML